MVTPASTWTARPFRPIYPTILVRFSRTRRGLTSLSRTTTVSSGDFIWVTRGRIFRMSASWCRGGGRGENGRLGANIAEKFHIVSHFPRKVQSNGIEDRMNSPEGPAMLRMPGELSRTSSSQGSAHRPQLNSMPDSGMILEEETIVNLEILQTMMGGSERDRSGTHGPNHDCNGCSHAQAVAPTTLSVHGCNSASAGRCGSPGRRHLAVRSHLNQSTTWNALREDPRWTCGPKTYLPCEIA